MSEDIIYRNFVTTEEELGRGIEMCYAAQRVVQKAYLEERSTLSIYVPREDLPYQQKHGANPGKPVLVGLVNSENKPVHIMPTQPLPCFSYLQPRVWPLFTSEERLITCIEILRENLFVVPRCHFAIMPFDDEMIKSITRGYVVINPEPEIFMGSFPFIDKDGALAYFAL